MPLELHGAFEAERGDPAFEGHFPGRPILPGVALIAEAMSALERATGTVARDWTLESAKFASPVVPGTRLEMTHREEAPGRVRFEIRAADRTVASGLLKRTSATP